MLITIIIMSKVTITTPIVIPTKCLADRPSSVGVTEAVGVTTIVVDGGLSNERSAIVNPELAYFESAAYNRKINMKILTKMYLQIQ